MRKACSRKCRPCGLRIRFRIYALDKNLGVDLRPNCEVVTFPGFAKNAYLRNAVAYPIELGRRPIDVLIAFSTLPAYAPCKTVLLLADVFWLANPGWLPWHIAQPRTLATRRSVEKADRVVTTTEFSRREIMRLLNVPAEKIVVVPDGDSNRIRGKGYRRRLSRRYAPATTLRSLTFCR